MMQLSPKRDQIVMNKISQKNEEQGGDKELEESTCDRTKRIVDVQRARLGLVGASFNSTKNLLTSP